MLTTMMMMKQAGAIMKTLHTTLLMLILSVSLSGCNTFSSNNKVANACNQGIAKLNQRLKSQTFGMIHQANLSRANSLLQAAQVQQQFAEYPGCIEKVQRAQDYLTGQQAAIISRL